MLANNYKGRSGSRILGVKYPKLRSRPRPSTLSESLYLWLLSSGTLSANDQSITRFRTACATVRAQQFVFSAEPGGALINHHDVRSQQCMTPYRCLDEFPPPALFREFYFEILVPFHRLHTVSGIFIMWFPLPANPAAYWKIWVVKLTRAADKNNKMRPEESTNAAEDQLQRQRCLLHSQWWYEHTPIFLL